MVKIEINGKVVKALEGDMLIDVADQAEIAIPRFCYHKKLSIAGNCRMCLVEVEGAWKPLPACATPVTDGMKVHTKSKKAIAAQKSVMEFLLINHPLDCPICDQGGECELQDVAVDYGDDVSRYSEPKRILGDRDVGSLIQTDMTRCIHCTRCVRFGQEIGGMMELGATGRSEFVQIGTYIKSAITSELSGNMIDICPVGALTSKPFRYSARAWELESHKGIAGHDAIGSNILMHTKSGVIKRVVPDENETINEVWISDKDRFAYEGVNSASRLKQPAIKKNGVWQDADWETAIAFAASKLQEEQDATQVGCLASQNSTLEELALLKKLMSAMGVENIDSRLQQIDFSIDQARSFSPVLAHSLPSVAKLKSVLLVGSHLRQELPLLNHRVRSAQLDGAAIHEVNPEDLDGNIDLASSMIANDFVALLAQVAKASCSLDNTPDYLTGVTATDAAQTVVDSLNKDACSAIMLGQIASTSSHYGTLIKLASVIAANTQSSLNVLPMKANEVGAHIVGFLPTGMNTVEMINAKLSTYVNFGIEPEFDLADGQAALLAMQNAACVINFTAFDSEAQRDYADVLLPIATFAETAGTFVNATGKQQSFRPAATPVGDAKPGWKVLRVLANVLDLPGFDYVNSNEIFAEVGTDIPAIDVDSLLVDLASTASLTYVKTPMYSTDVIVRHSPALQAMQDVLDASAAP